MNGSREYLPLAKAKFPQLEAAGARLTAFVAGSIVTLP